VTRFAPGDAVYGARGEKFVAHAEFACVPEDGFIAPKPATMTFEEAGTVFVGAACSLYFLRRANVKPGERGSRAWSVWQPRCVRRAAGEAFRRAG
jgi:NADPH:quinone reductase-like Zn-dependent oxidoreductase